MNESRTEQNPTTIVQPCPPPYGYDPQGDEISLIDLWRVLIKQKNIILGVTAITTIGAVLYALSLPPVYKAETSLLPPSESDIQALNVQGVQSLSAESAYDVFKKNLGMKVVRQTIFEEMNLLDQFAPERAPNANIDAILDGFNQSLSLTIPKTKKGGDAAPSTLTLSMEGKNPILIAEIINRIVKESERTATAEIILNIEAKVNARTRDLNQEIQLLREKRKKQRLDEIERLEASDALKRNTINDKISSLQKKARSERFAEISRLNETDRIEREGIEEKIKTLRNSAKEKRLDRLAVLQEAAEIAHSLEIKNPIGYKLKKISESGLNKSQIFTDISDNAPLLYTRGYEALEAEISSLSNRTSDDPFIPGLRGLLDRLTQLENNEKITALKARESDNPFIPELRTLQEQLTLLEHNRKVAQLKSRQNDDPFISSLRDKENELARLVSIHIDPKTVTTARLDQAAYPPAHPIKPKRKLIVVLGFALGLMLGIFGAFFSNFLGNLRENEEEL
jgi:LPS O-antigen subunit length determinant protein (WzzB/FepE family)